MKTVLARLVVLAMAAAVLHHLYVVFAAGVRQQSVSSTAWYWGMMSTAFVAGMLLELIPFRAALRPSSLHVGIYALALDLSCSCSAQRV